MWLDYFLDLLGIVTTILMITVPLLLSVAYLTYLERKVIAAVQMRKGPNVVGPFGLLQPIADAVKLLFKEVIIPDRSSKIVFLLAPVLTFTLALIGWAVIPFDGDTVLADINVGVLYLLAISSLGVYGIIMAGWASNSKYAFLGAIRSSAQMISYEVAIGFVVITVLIAAGTLNLTELVYQMHGLHWYLQLLLLPMMIVFFVSILAETNRHPFDLPEAEAELVAGFNVEYSSMTFALFFLGEYANMILMSGFMTILFLGGWMPPTMFGLLTQVEVLSPIYNLLDLVPGMIWFMLKIFALLVLFLLVRAAYPRYRYDQLMRLGWKVFLPLTGIWVVLISGILVYTDFDTQHSNAAPVSSTTLVNAVE